MTNSIILVKTCCKLLHAMHSSIFDKVTFGLADIKVFGRICLLAMLHASDWPHSFYARMFLFSTFCKQLNIYFVSTLWKHI